MTEIRDDLEELRRRLGDGGIQRAYVAIVGYLSRLRGRLDETRPEWAVTGLYQGCFDMTYFGLVTPSLKERGLKLAIVFDYGSFRFQVWLAARNRDLQRRYFGLLREHGWSADTLVQPAVGVDAIVAVDAADGLDLVDPGALDAAIERAAEGLLADVEAFLAAHDAPTA